MPEPADPARRAVGTPHAARSPRPQRERIELAVTLLAVIAVPALIAIWLGYHSLAFYGVMGAAFVLIMAMPMAASVSFPAALISGLAVLVTLQLGHEPLPLALWMGALALCVGLVSVVGYHRAGTLVALSACVFIARPVPAGDLLLVTLMFTGGGIYGAIVARAVRKGPPRARARIPATWAVVYGVLLAGLISVATGVTVALDIPHGYWAVLAILIVAQPTGGTAGRASKRAIAVIIGVAASLLIVQVVHTQAVFTILTAVAVALAAYQATSTRPYFLTSFMSIAFILASGSTDAAESTAVVRFVTNLVAISATVAVAAAVSWVVGHRGRGNASAEDADDADDLVPIPGRLSSAP
ncbi:MAG: FUSC family protein [Chloroflexota bacterium]